MRALQGPRPVKLNARNHAQLRIGAIDALETHYSTGGGTYHQPLNLATAAVDALLSFAGIRNVHWNSGRRTVIEADDGTRGYILSRSVEKNGRPVAFVFAGEPDEADGADVFLDAERMNESYNYQAALDGHAYATFYRGLFRAAFIEAIEEARQDRRGIYSSDATNADIDGTSLEAITEQVAIMPKLFRRLTDYIVSTGSAVGFKEALEKSEEPVLDLRHSNFTHFDTFVDQADDSPHLRLVRRPEELVFDEMVLRPSNAFAVLAGADDELSLIA